MSRQQLEQYLAELVEFVEGKVPKDTLPIIRKHSDKKLNREIEIYSSMADEIERG